MKFCGWGCKKDPIEFKHSPACDSRKDSQSNQPQYIAASDNIVGPLGPRIGLNGDQPYAGSFCSFAGALNGSSKRMVLQGGEEDSSLADSCWVDKLNHKLGDIFSHEHDGLLSIGTLALDPMEGVRQSIDQQQHQYITSDSHEFSAGGCDCRKSSAGRDLNCTHESPEVRESVVTDSAELTETSSEMKVISVQTLPPRATSKGSRRNSSARSSGGMSRSPSQVCPFLSDLETPCAKPTNRPPSANSHSTGLACGLLPTRLSRRSKRRQQVKSEGNLQDHGMRQRSTKVTTLRRLRKLWQPKYAASDFVSPKAVAAHEQRKNLIKLTPLKTQQKEHVAARKSPDRSVKTQKKWPYRDGGQVNSGGLRRKLQPQKWLPCRSHGMAEEKSNTRASEKELNQFQRTRAEQFVGEQQQGQWIKTDSEYLVLEM